MNLMILHQLDIFVQAVVFSVYFINVMIAVKINLSWKTKFLFQSANQNWNKQSIRFFVILRERSKRIKRLQYKKDIVWQRWKNSVNYYISNVNLSKFIKLYLNCTIIKLFGARILWILHTWINFIIPSFNYTNWQNFKYSIF